MFVYSIFNQGDLGFIWRVFEEGLGLAGGQHTSHVCTIWPFVSPECSPGL